MNNMRVENWCGYHIRFVEVDGEWWAILKDICDALGLRTAKVAERLHHNMLTRVKVEASDVPLRDHRSRGENESRWMLAVNEYGIYQALFASKRLEARKFTDWTFTVLQRLRKHVGLQGYEVMRMTDADIQDEIDYILDSFYYDDKTKKLMISVTVPGGDVDQIQLDEYLKEGGVNVVHF